MVESSASEETSGNTLQPDTNTVPALEVTEEDVEQSTSHKVEDNEVKKEEELHVPSPVETEDDQMASTKAAEGTGEEREVDQEHSPSQKKSRGRRKKFKTASERTDQAS